MRPEPRDRPPPRDVPTSAVRPYLLTGGRARPTNAGLEIEAQVVATESGLAALHRHVYEQHAIIAACAVPMAVVEVASRLGLHIGVTRVLVGDLITLGHLAVRRPERGRQPNTQTIERVIRGLQAIR